MESLRAEEGHGRFRASPEKPPQPEIESGPIPCFLLDFCFLLDHSPPFQALYPGVLGPIP